MGPAVEKIDTFHPVRKANLAPFGHLRREEYLRRHRNLDLYIIVALPQFSCQGEIIDLLLGAGALTVKLENEGKVGRWEG